jgi:hypothetical protein
VKLEVNRIYWKVPALTSPTPGGREGGTKFDLSIDLMGSSASQESVESTMARPRYEAGKADLSLPAVAVGAQADLLILNSPPETIHEYVVVTALAS